MSRNINLIFLLFVISVFSVPICGAEGTKAETNKSDKTVDSILGALADMTVEQAKKMLSLSFTRDIREKVCGYKSYLPEVNDNSDIEGKELKDKKGIRTIFSNTCEHVKEKVERNIFSSDLIEQFKQDMVLNGVALIRISKYSTVSVSSECNYFVYDNLGTDSASRLKWRDLVVHRCNMRMEIDDYKNDLVVAKFIHLLWLKNSFKDAVQHALSESKSYQTYGEYIAKVLDTSEDLKKIKNILKDSIDIEFVDKKIVLNYLWMSDDGVIEKKNYSFETAVKFKDSSKEEVARAFYKIAIADDKAGRKQRTRELVRLLLSQDGCTGPCMESVNLLIENKPREIFSALSGILTAKDEFFLESSKDFDNMNTTNYKAIKVLGSLSELSNVQDKEAAKSVFEKYLADENSRTARYWQHSFSLGTSLGVAAGYVKCDGCTNKSYPSPQLYMPFGLTYTKGWFGLQAHVFDLGQYTSYKPNNESTEWKDAVAPGIAIFGRLRRYPVSFGLDFTHQSSAGLGIPSEDQVRLFVAMDIPLFNLN
jgi:hypothetical protein